MSVLHSERHENGLLATLVLGLGIGVYAFSLSLQHYVIPPKPMAPEKVRSVVKLVMAPEPVPEVVTSEPEPEPEVVKPAPKPKPKPVAKPTPKPVSKPSPEPKPKNEAQALNDLFGAQPAKPVTKPNLKASVSTKPVATATAQPSFPTEVAAQPFKVAKNSQLEQAIQATTSDAAQKIQAVDVQVTQSATLSREIESQSGAVDQSLNELFASLKGDIQQAVMISGESYSRLRLTLHLSGGKVDSVAVKGASASLEQSLRTLLLNRTLPTSFTGTKAHTLILS